jgi:hypothetical protein
MNASNNSYWKYKVWRLFMNSENLKKIQHIMHELKEIEETMPQTPEIMSEMSHVFLALGRFCMQMGIYYMENEKNAGN